MALYVNSDEVDALAIELQQLTKARSKTEAVRTALVNEIARTKRAVPLRQRLKPIKERARKLGLPNADFGQKQFTDEMWEE